LCDFFAQVFDNQYSKIDFTQILKRYLLSPQRIKIRHLTLFILHSCLKQEWAS